MLKNRKTRTAYIVSHTHWDREWRYPVWETRQMLVKFMDELVEVLESGEYVGFLLDGQVIPILDYLNIHPEMKQRIKVLVTSGKLQIGPWFLLPDEYPVDGEALVRNLLWGHRYAKELGGVFNVGYTSFGWGQTAQLPQIYAGFGINTAMIGKKVSKDRAPHSEFIWRAPDGTELLTTRFGQLGRQNFYLKMHLSALFGVNHETSDWNYNWSDGGLAYHRADREQMEQEHFRLDAPTCWHSEIITPELIEEVWQTTDESVIDTHRLMMNGCDYSACQKMLPELIRLINEKDPDKQRQWIQATMPEFIEIMRENVDRSKLAVVKGELRDGPAIAVTGNALSTRLYIKKLNKKAQNMLIRFAEPLAVLTAMLGNPFPQRFINEAWKYLLEAHPHDSINGVTQDKTATDVEYRLNQVIDISQTVANQSMQELVRRIDMSEFDDKDVLVAVFNPLPYPSQKIIEAWVNMPKQQVYNYLIPSPDGLMVYDAKNQPVDTQWEGFEENAYNVAELHTRTFPYYCRQHRVFFDTGQIPAGGYKVFRVGSIEYDRIEPSAAWTDSRAKTGNILKAPDILENEHIKIQMNPNGTFDLTHKKLEQTFRNLNYYEDRGESGDYWVNKRPMFDQVHNSLGCSAKIWSEESGPLQATLVSEIKMELPNRCIAEQQRRGDKPVDLIIRTSVTLQAGDEQVEVNVEFENCHEDHCLRAMFPTSLSKATDADAGGHFAVDHRPIRPQGPTPHSVWPDMATLPQNNFLDVSDGQLGIAFLNDSLTEYEVLDNDDRTVALTLLRAVKNWICTERVGSDFPSQKGGQCLGHHKIRYAIMPHKSNWQSANIPLAAEQFNVPPVPVQTRKHTGSLPAGETSLFEIDNANLRFSTLKKTEDSDTFIVRLYNPTDKQQKGNLNFAVPLTSAWLTNLNEEREKEIDLNEADTVPITAASNKIITVEIEIQKVSNRWRATRTSTRQESTTLL